jgi:hypothetical protein
MRTLTALACILALTTVAGGQRAFFSLEYKQRADPAKYWPLQVGAEWDYLETYSSALDASGAVFTTSWTSTYSIRARVDVPEGTAVFRQKRVSNVHSVYPPAATQAGVSRSKETAPDRSVVAHYLVAGNYVFEFWDLNWDSRAQSLTPEYRQLLKDGELTPVFFFPPCAASVWSERVREQQDLDAARLFEAGTGPAPNPVMYYWSCEGQEDIEVPAGKMSGVYSFIYRTIGGPSRVWFAPGIGVVKESSFHSGTYFESSSVLVRFRSPQGEPQR